MVYKRVSFLFILSACIYSAIYLYNPTVRYVDPKDSRYSKPMYPSTIPFNILLPETIIIPIVVFFLCSFYSQMDFKTSVSIYATIITVSLFTLGITENTKRIVGRPRPDFIERCMPDSFGKCTGDLKKILVGYQSFPSGHTSASFSAICLIIYLLFLQRIRKLYILVISFILFIVGTMMGYSRILDNRHFPSDVVGGAFTGLICMATVCFPIHSKWKKAVPY